MMTHPTSTSSISASAAALLSFLQSEQVHWIVLSYAWIHGVAGLDELEFARAVEELEAAELVERAAYGPLLYIR